MKILTIRQLLRSKLGITKKIPEFIKDHFKYYNFIYKIVPLRYKCGCVFARFTRNRAFDFIYLYRSWFKKDLKSLIEEKFNFKCPKCYKVLINEQVYNAIFIDLDSKAVFIYDENISKKKSNRFYECNFNHNGYKLNHFDSANFLKDTLIKKYNLELINYF